ncbi:hypothetical protein GYMLUDRAFT_680762 [Collybiopsis luxurians FD-317 M1]|uniref:Uncharacterized protein n=1 Tax=Collybiopsis luxurians FD-317 M1 TaxID=944289 RepID=A0A0D0CTJ8_9AGAR|nr:hypothetical protein GYMLUDRAFT_680762 [Collybiopsis luxurians FD-317 M1]
MHLSTHLNVVVTLLVLFWVLFLFMMILWFGVRYSRFLPRTSLPFPLFVFDKRTNGRTNKQTNQPIQSLKPCRSLHSFCSVYSFLSVYILLFSGFVCLFCNTSIFFHDGFIFLRADDVLKIFFSSFVFVFDASFFETPSPTSPFSI